MKMKGKTIIDEQTGIVVVQAGDELAMDRWSKIGAIIENIDELWQVVNHTIDQPHISVVLSNLQWMSALRDKIQTQINKLEEREITTSYFVNTVTGFQ